MKPLIPHAIAALLAAGAVSLATAQTAPVPSPAVPFVAEPIASSSKADGPDTDLAKLVAQALNADQSLKNSKITVQVDENGNILLTGATVTQEQALRAAEVAGTQAGDAKVVNVIQSDRIVYRTPAAS